jgi:hypothetical protein
MRKMASFVVLAVVLSGLCALAPGCSGARSSASIGTSQHLPDSTVPLDKSGSKRLDAVGVSEAHIDSAIPSGSLAHRAYYDRHMRPVDVTISAIVRGVDVEVVVPMWCGTNTIYVPRSVDETPVPMPQAIADKSIVWAGGSGSVTYHFEDGVFVLDRYEAPIQR